MRKVRARMIGILVLMVVGIFALTLRLGYVQVLKGTALLERAYELWTRDIPVDGQRGNIYDRNGKLIVGNKLAPTVVIIPKQVKEKERAIKFLAEVLERNEEDIRKHFEKNVSVEIIKPAGRHLSLEVAKKIAKEKLDGVYIASDTVRYYPYGNLLSHTIGITGIDNQGITGLEYIYDAYLKGSSGANKIFTDAHGNKFLFQYGHYVAPNRGLDLYLTIDLDIQIVLERVLDNAMERYQPDEIWAIVMHPKTSEILAIASRPNFDLVNYQDYPQELYNRNLPIWKSYEPGSVFKVITFAAGINEKVFSPTETFYDPGYWIVDGTRINDWRAGGHGHQTFFEVLQNSCNPGLMEIVFRLGKDKFFEYLEKFGFGEKTGVDLLGESTGIVFEKDKINNVELATSSFGQGNTITAIQLVNAINAACNDGTLNQPYILKGFGIPNTQTLIFQNETKTIRTGIVTPETSAIVREALERVATLGTARGGHVEGYRVGGKTGTAQVPEGGVYLSDKYIISYLGMAPMNDPQITIYMAMFNPKNTIQYGGIVVAPLVREIMAESLTILKIPKQPGGIEFQPRWLLDKFTYKVENYIGQKVASIPLHPYYKFKIVGNGDTVIAQAPNPGEKIVENGFVILYTN